MALVQPFRAYRYNPAVASYDRVLTQPYDKITPKRQEEYYATDPHNLIAIEKGRVQSDDTPQSNVYTRAAASLRSWIGENVVQQDPAPAFYAYSQEFTFSDANRQRIFDLAKALDYFHGDLEAKLKNIAKTGQKTLEYHGKGASGGQAISTSATYNYSSNPDVQELTRLFQAVATTIDFGRKLAFQYRFDKLGLDARLNSLQEMQASHFAEELQAIEPILQKIASDPNMMHINRVTAKQLLKSIGPTVAPNPVSAQP